MQLFGKKVSRRTLLVSVAGLGVVLLAGLAGYFLWIRNSPQVQEKAGGSQTGPADIIRSTARLYRVPTDEQPTVALIKDKSKLAGQSFYKDVENGDYVVVYKQAKLALLYRPSDNILINVGPVSFHD